MPKVSSIQIGAVKSYGDPLAEDPMDLPWTTGFFKEPVQGPIQVFREQLEGDGQADLVNHGGADKAILGYAASHYDQWYSELGHRFTPGGFGENLTIDEQTEDTVCVGDVYRLGSAILEVSQPRQPCWKLGRRWRMKTLPALVVQSGRSGWYFRVLQTGLIEAEQEFILEDRPNPEWTITQCNRVQYHMKNDRVIAAELAAIPALSESWRQMMLKRANG